MNTEAGKTPKNRTNWSTWPFQLRSLITFYPICSDRVPRLRPSASKTSKLVSPQNRPSRQRQTLRWFSVLDFDFNSIWNSFNSLLLNCIWWRSRGLCCSWRGVWRWCLFHLGWAGKLAFEFNAFIPQIYIWGGSANTYFDTLKNTFWILESQQMIRAVQFV